MGRACSMYGVRKDAYRVLVDKPEGTRLLWRRTHRQKDNIETDLQEVGCRAWTGLICFRMGTGGWLLWMWEWTFGFHEMQRISWLAEDMLASQGLCCMETFTTITATAIATVTIAYTTVYHWGKNCGSKCKRCYLLLVFEVLFYSWYMKQR
jgi:hypothetical protein